LEGIDPLARARLVPLVWSLGLAEVACIVIAICAHLHGRIALVVSAVVLAAAAGASLMRMRGMSEPPPPLVLLSLLLGLGAAMLVDVAVGASVQCAAISLPTTLWLAGLFLSRAGALAWSAIALGALLVDMALVGKAEFAPSTWLCLPYPMAQACLVGSRWAQAVRALHVATGEARAGVRSLRQVERREQERFVDFNAMCGSWYWETEADLTLRFVAPGLVKRLGLADGMLHGRTLVCLIRSSRPDANGVYDLTHAMDYELGIRGRHLLWCGEDRIPAVVRFDAWPAYSACGEFRGYRGRARDMRFGACRRGDRRR
jgi:hypothetical protein